MTVSLSPELRQALANHPGERLELVDDATRERYVLVPADQFDRLKSLLSSDDFQISETYAAQSQALAEARWDDAELDVYNDYDAHRP